MEAEYTKKKIKNELIITAGLENSRKCYIRCFLKGREISCYSSIGRGMLDYDKLNESKSKASKLEAISQD